MSTPGWKGAEADRTGLPQLVAAVEAATKERDAANSALEALGLPNPGIASSNLATKAKELIALANLGRHLGLQDGHCPLCAKLQDSAAFQSGIEVAELLAKQRKRVAQAH